MAKSVGKKIIWGIIIIILGIQFVPVNRNNPPITAPINASSDFTAIIKRSCYDCHSNESEWPWYSFVAPVSWMVASHVHEGREHLNFSTWEDLPHEKQLSKAEEIWEEVEEGEMPLSSYLIMHNNAVLSNGDRETIKAWSVSYGIPDSLPDIDGVDSSLDKDTDETEDDD